MKSEDDGLDPIDSDNESSPEKKVDFSVVWDNTFTQMYSGHANIRTVKEGQKIPGKYQERKISEIMFSFFS